LAVALLAGCSLTKGLSTFSRAPSAEVDIAIITVLPAEYHAVLRKLENVREVVEPFGEPNLYVWATGEVHSRDGVVRRLVVAMAGEAGEVSGALATQATMDRWKPKDVLLVGIAGGVHESVGLGDIVVSRQIWGYEHGHLGTRYESGGVLFFQPDPTLVQAALDLGEQWRRKIEIAPPDHAPPPKVFAGKTASGDKVIESTGSAYFAESLRLDETILSVDMEGTGASAAIGKGHDRGGTTGFVMIRAISDLVGDHNRSGRPLFEQGRNPERALWKAYSAEVAATFAVELIRSNWPE